MLEENTLSDREEEVLQLVATGLTNREIAQKLTISPNTVKVHLRHIFEKLGAASRTEATLFAIEHGIVDVPGGEAAAGAGAEAPEPTRLERLIRNPWVMAALFVITAAFIVLAANDVLFPPEPPETTAMAEMAERWQEFGTMPEPRSGMAAAAYDGAIYTIAGESPEGVSDSVFRYSPETDTWETLADKPTPVSDVQAALIGEKIYVPGGLTADSTPTDKLEIYDPRNLTWEAGAPLPQAISAYALASFEGQVYLFGGWDGEKALDNVYIYDPVEDAWREGTPMPTARYDAGAAALADKIVVLGGRNGSGVVADAAAYYPSRDLNGEDPWGEFLDMPEARYDFGVASIYDTVYVVGGLTGEDRQAESTGWLMTGEEWVSFETIQDYNQRSTVMVPLGSQLIIFDLSETGEETRAWAYQAFYFSIYIPLVP